MRIMTPMFVAAALAMPGIAQAQQTQSAPGWQQTLGGLMTGNQNQDNSLRQAYDRGYQRGRDDEARAQHADSNYSTGQQYGGNGQQYGNNDQQYGNGERGYAPRGGYNGR